MAVFKTLHKIQSRRTGKGEGGSWEKDILKTAVLFMRLAAKAAPPSQDKHLRGMGLFHV